jgi:hypothetical protein
VDRLELRCGPVLHGIVLPDGKLEVKCRSRFCGHEPGVVVLHQFDVHTGAVTTKRYRDPAHDSNKEE